ncbi:PREDICTED: titin-like isoform X2 [Vollenhovia emeryi]|uniref:titin-like isoform X2 n=1 Tax=Vollenhovia emeryi TaxID=411798 RepID=UPI0005F55BDA|nr:PREDICTED: titin-like isoform X2 [Vollenhovia emeryi]
MTEEITVEEVGQLPATTVIEGPVEEIVEETVLPVPRHEFAKSLEEKEVSEQVTVIGKIIQDEVPKHAAKKKITKHLILEHTTDSNENKGEQGIETTNYLHADTTPEIHDKPVKKHDGLIKYKVNKEIVGGTKDEIYQEEELSDNIPAEAVDEIVIKKAELQKAQLLIDEEGSVEITTIDVKKAPEEKISIIEEKESTEKPIQKIAKTKKVPKKKEQRPKEIEEIKVKEVVEMPITESIKENKHVIETTDVLDEIVQEIQMDMPKKEKAKSMVEAREETVMITELETIEKPVAKSEIIEKEEITEIIETPTKKRIKRKKVKSHEDNIPEEILEEIILEKPDMEQARTIFSPTESIEITQILTESSITKFPDDKTTPEKAAVHEIIKEEPTLKKILQEETKTIPVQEEITIETTREIVNGEKPKEEEVQLTIITKEGLNVTETISDTSTEDFFEKVKPIKEKILPVKEEESQVGIKEVIVKTVPTKGEPIYASEQVEEGTVEDITSERPIQEKAERTIITNEGIKTTEIISEITTSELDKGKTPQEEQIIPTQETDENIKSADVIIKKMPLVNKKATEVKEDRPEEAVEDIKIKKPTKEKAKKDILLQESVEILEVTTEIKPEEFVTEKIIIEKEAETSVAPIETIKITGVTPAVTDGKITEKEEVKPVRIDVEEEKEKELTPVKKEVIQEEDKMIEEISVKPKMEQTKIDKVAVKTKEVAEVIPETKMDDTLIKKKPKDKLKEVTSIRPEETKEFEKPKEEIVTTVEEKPKSTEKKKEKKVVKKKKKPVKTDIEEWVEPEYERPVLEPMPEKIQWEPTKKKEKKILPESVQKLIPHKIVRKEIKPTKLQYMEPFQEKVQFGTIKLKKVPIIKKKAITEPIFPKIMLRSRITFIGDYPTELQMPKITYMEKNPVQAGILSRNTEEALKIIKKQYKKPKISEKDITELEKLDKEFEELKKVPLEQIEDKSIYERTPKKSQETPKEPQKLIIGKGEIKQEAKIVPEDVKLKKISVETPEQVTETKQKPTKEESLEDTLQKKKDKPKETLTFDEFKPTEFDSPEIEKYIPEEFETPKKPEIEPVSKPYEPSKKKKPEQDIEQIPLIKGIPKPHEPEEEPEVRFRIPTSEKPEDEPETITLKGWKKDKPEQESSEEYPTKEKDAPKMPKDITDEDTVKQKIKPKKIKEKTKKLVPEKEEHIPEEITEKVTLMKPRKDSLQKEIAEEVTIKKPVIEERTEDVEEVTEEVTLKKKPKKKQVTEEAAAEITVKKPIPKEKKEISEDVSEKVVLKKPKKEILEEVADEVTIKKPVVEKKIEDVEEVTLKSKPRKKVIETEEISEVTITKPIEDKKVEEIIETSTDVLLKKKVPAPKIEDVISEELTVRKMEIVEQPEEVIEEFTLKRKPPKKAPKPIEEIYEDVTLRKLRPKKKSRPDIKEVTEVENVTFRPRSTKTKEDVEQEFKISLNTYEEEDISMSGKVRLKPKRRPLTYSEETGEETIKIIQEIEDDSGPIIEEIIDESEEEGKEEYSIEELDIDEMNIPLRRKKKKQKAPYAVEEIEEDNVKLQLKRDRKYSYEETDAESLALKLKSKRRISTFEEEEASLSITKEEEISEEVDELEYVVREGDTMFSICSYIAETEEAINLVEGERVYIIDHTNQDWWFVKKHLTEEKGWVPAQYLLDEAHYTIYLQRKLNEKIDKLPIFEKPAPGEKASAPRFIEKLQPIHTLDGYTVQFECQVEGIPRPQITWFRQTAIIKPSTDFQMYYDEDNVATLIIREVFPEDAGTFTCVAKNAAGFASSTTELIVEAPLSDHGSDVTGLSRKSLSRESSLADILEGIPPTFSRKPKAKYVNENDDVILECRLVAVPEPEITWYHKDAPVVSEQNIIVATESDMHMYCSVVKFTKIQKKQEGRYKIIAKNREGEATIDIPVKVKTGKSEPPEILEPLQSHVVKEGETVVLSTQIVGNPSPKIMWYKDGKPIKDLQLKQDGHVNTLNLIQPQLADSGEYLVTAINDMGKAETRATLTVEKVPSGAPEPPLFTKRFQEIIVPERGTFKLVAKVTGNPVPEVTWLRNNKPLDKSANITESYDGENISLEIKNADSEVDAGDYKCVASNPVGKASHGAKVTVDVAKVSFTRHLQTEVVIDEYKILELSCETSHTVSTVWWHNDKEISGMDHREIMQEGRIHKLLIKKSGLSDAGTYKCTVKNQMTSSNVIVRATKPEFVKKLQDIEVKERDVAILEVEITSQMADVTWRKDGELLTQSKGKLEFVKDGTVRKLFIRSASVHDEGEYTCALPDQECTAEVTVVELPPEIITKMQDTTVAGGEKATFDIELTKGDALVRWFKDGQELQFSEHVRLSIDGKRQKLKIYDTEVEDAGIYSCQVGDQTSSARLTVEEPEVDFIKKLPDVTLVPVNTDATFLIELSRADVPVTWLRKNETIDYTQSSKYSIIDEGNIKKLIVKKCTTEDIAEYTATVANVKTSSRLKIEVIETPPRIYPDTLRKYKTMKGDDIDIIVRFTAKPTPTDEWTVNGHVLKKSKRIIPSIDECSAVLTIRDAQEKDFGDYNLQLTNPHGEDSIEINVIVVQLPGAPGIPEPLEITDNSITLHWKKPDSDGHSSIIEYILEYREKTETSWSKITETIIETTYQLTNLVADKEYTFHVTAVNEAGPGEASADTPYLRISKLSASEPPTVLEALKSIVIGLGEVVTLSCVIGGVPTPRITWLKDGEAFEDNDITYENHVAKYTIRKTTETSSSTFTVKAQNDAGMAETSCRLKIQESPKITCDENLRNQRLTVGDHWKVEINLTGFPKPEVTWSINNTEITDKRISIETKENTSIITIPSLVRDDTANYTVKASNEAGSSSMECHLRIIDKPSKPQGPVVAKEIRQDRVTIEWRPPIDDGGVELESYTIEKCEANKKVWTKVGDVDKEVENFCAQKLQQDVDYLFRIVAKNAVGLSDPLESEPIRTRTSFDTPGPPRGPLQVFGMTKTSFTLKWESPENDGGTPITEYIVEMKEISKKAWKKIASTKGEVTNVTISDLKTDTSYNFRITARNNVGAGPPYTAEEAITVGKRPKIIKLTENSMYALLGIFPSTKIMVVKTPPSCPLNVRAANVTSKSVTLSWSPPFTTGGSELTGYVIEKKPLIGKGARWTKVVTLDATTHQYCIENLKESEFLFRVFAENSIGLSIPSNSEPVTLKTHANVPSPPTAPLEMRQIAANTMVIEWGRPESDGGASLEGYKIAIRDAKKTMWMEVGRVSADIQKLNIRDLQENHEYLVRIFARNEIGFSDHLESEEPFKIVPTSELSCVEPIAEAVDKGETASVSFSTENTSSWLREHNMDADIHSYARARLLGKDEYFFRIWHYAKKLFE